MLLTSAFETSALWIYGDALAFGAVFNIIFPLDAKMFKVSPTK